LLVLVDLVRIEDGFLGAVGGEVDYLLDLVFEVVQQAGHRGVRVVDRQTVRALRQVRHITRAVQQCVGIAHARQVRVVGIQTIQIRGHSRLTDLVYLPDLIELPDLANLADLVYLAVLVVVVEIVFVDVE